MRLRWCYLREYLNKYRYNYGLFRVVLTILASPVKVNRWTARDISTLPAVPAICLSDFQCCKGFASAARHNEFAAVCFFEAVDNIIKRFFLMILEMKPSLFIGELFGVL